MRNQEKVISKLNQKLIDNKFNLEIKHSSIYDAFNIICITELCTFELAGKLTFEQVCSYINFLFSALRNRRD